MNSVTMRMTSRRRHEAALVLAFALSVSSAVTGAEWSLSDEELDRLDRGEVLVYADSEGDATGGSVRAAVRIDAPAEHVFRTMTDCSRALRYVPHLERCKVLETAPDGSWQIIEHEIDFGWFVRRMRYVFRAVYTPFEQIRFTHIRGDFRVNEGIWELRPTRDGAGTLVMYRAHAVPRFYVPRWLMRATMKRDLPALMTALRAECEPTAPVSITSHAVGVPSGQQPGREAR